MNNYYTTYNPQTGEISGVLHCRPETAELNGPYVLGEYSPEKYRVVDGVPVEKGVEEIEANQISLAWGSIRSLRNSLLKDSDWTQVPDAPVDQAAWAAYRQQLRDLPSNTTDPRNPTWPTPPA